VLTLGKLLQNMRISNVSLQDLYHRWGRGSGALYPSDPARIDVSDQLESPKQTGRTPDSGATSSFPLSRRYKHRRAHCNYARQTRNEYRRLYWSVLHTLEEDIWKEEQTWDDHRRLGPFEVLGTAIGTPYLQNIEGQRP